MFNQRVEDPFDMLLKENPTCRIKSHELEAVTLGKNVSILNGTILDHVCIQDFSYISNDSTIRNANIGRFCSISSNVKIGLFRHPSRTFVSTHPAFYSNDNTACITSFSTKKSFDDSVPKTYLANDVWIGTGVIIPGGITVGTGAIIAAGSVVVKDVPPYAVVGGNPAKIIRMRFSDTHIAGLLESAWWDWPIERIQRNVEKFSTIDKFETCDFND